MATKLKCIYETYHIELICSYGYQSMKYAKLFPSDKNFRTVNLHWFQDRFRKYFYTELCRTTTKVVHNHVFLRPAAMYARKHRLKLPRKVLDGIFWEPILFQYSIFSLCFFSAVSRKYSRVAAWIFEWKYVKLSKWDRAEFTILLAHDVPMFVI